MGWQFPHRRQIPEPGVVAAERHPAREAVAAKRHRRRSRNNPMGVAAMTLAGGEYAIHGTNAPGSIGGFVSYGCIRMYNADITDLSRA